MVGTFDLIINGEIQDAAGDALGNQLQAAIDAVNDMDAGGSTNYEAGLAQAKEWIEGGTVDVTNAHEFDADTNVAKSDAFVLTDANGVRIAVVSGWDDTTFEQQHDHGTIDSDPDGFGVGENDEHTERRDAARSISERSTISTMAASSAWTASGGIPRIGHFGGDVLARDIGGGDHTVL